jgi:hypothetical protein
LGVRILHRIVQDRGDHNLHVRAVGGLGDEIRHLGEVVHIGLGGFALAALCDVPGGREIIGAGQARDDIQGVHGS